MRRKLLPFYDERKSKIEMIVLHCTAHTPENIVESFTKHRVSSHYVIGEDGQVVQMVGEKHRAWHAGISSWGGKTDINSRSIGIELTSPTLGQKPFSQRQKNALIELLSRLIKKYKILPQNIVGHSDVAPTRKADPGKCFFWQELADKGIGLWGDKLFKYAVQNSDEKELLQTIGYDTTDLKAARLAFCRRFIPKAIGYKEDVWNIEKDLPQTIQDFKEPSNFREVLSNIAQQYESASKTPCKI